MATGRAACTSLNTALSVLMRGETTQIIWKNRGTVFNERNWSRKLGVFSFA